MTIFMTGATGYIGGYVVERLLRENPKAHLAVLTRAKSRDDGLAKMWSALEMHVDAETFWEMASRIEIVPGDLTAPRLGMDPGTYDSLAKRLDSVLHVAASLNRNSEKSCLNHNLRGTLAVLELARAAKDHHGLRRFGYVSTVAVAGERSHEVVREDQSIDWDRKDYDPYGRTKKFGEHMVRTLLPDVPITIYRPSMVIGDSRFPRTSQFDMIRAVCFLADLPVVPVGPDVREDIVNADWVGKAIAHLHMKDAPAHDCYHLSAGTDSVTAQEIGEAICHYVGKRVPVYAERLSAPFSGAMTALAAYPGRNTATYIGTLFKVFMPYVTYDTVFDNTRAVTELGEAPTRFDEYCGPLYAWCKETGFRYDAKPMPGRPVQAAVGQQVA